MEIIAGETRSGNYLTRNCNLVRVVFMSEYMVTRYAAHNNVLHRFYSVETIMGFLKSENAQYDEPINENSMSIVQQILTSPQSYAVCDLPELDLTVIKIDQADNQFDLNKSHYQSIIEEFLPERSNYLELTKVQVMGMDRPRRELAYVTRERNIMLAAISAYAGVQVTEYEWLQAESKIAGESRYAEKLANLAASYGCRT